MAEYILEYEDNARAQALGLAGMPESWAAGLGAAFDETLARNPTRAILNSVERARYQDQTFVDEMGQEHFVPGVPSRILTREEANTQYGIPGKLEFDADTPEPVAEQLHQLNMDELFRQDVRRRSSAGIGADLLAGIGGSLLDPINVGSAFIPVVGEARFAALAGALGRPGGRLAAGAIEGTVGAAMVEPIVYLGAQAESADYTAADSLMNLVFGGAIGGGLHLGAGYIGDRWAGRLAASPVQNTFDDLPMEHRATTIAAAAQQIAEGRPVDVVPVVSAAIEHAQATGFMPPHEFRMANYEVEAAEFGLTDVQRKAFMPEDVRDYVTGFYRAEDRVPTIERAQKYATETGQTAVYVKGDIANLGGLNNRFGHSGADTIYREMAGYFADAIKEVGGTGVLVRHGDDEISAIVVGATPESIEQALMGMKPKIADMVDRRGLGDIPHAKSAALPPGTRINYGISQIEPGMRIGKIIERADTAVELEKKRGRKYGDRSATGTVGPAALEGSARAIAGGTGTPRAGAGAVAAAERRLAADEELRAWNDKQGQPYVDPETETGMRVADDMASMESGAPKETQELIADIEQELAELERMIPPEARETTAVEDAPSTAEIATLESQQATYEVVVQRAATCLTGRT